MSCYLLLPSIDLRKGQGAAGFNLAHQRPINASRAPHHSLSKQPLHRSRLRGSLASILQASRALRLAWAGLWTPSQHFVLELGVGTRSPRQLPGKGRIACGRPIKRDTGHSGSCEEMLVCDGLGLEHRGTDLRLFVVCFKARFADPRAWACGQLPARHVRFAVSRSLC